MAIKQGKYRPPTNDYNDVIHFETDSEMVIMGDGSKLEDKLKQMENNAYDAGGSGNSYTVAGLALVDNGTYVVIPNHSNTGTTTLNGKGIKKFNVDSDAYIDLEEGDIVKNTPIQLVWDNSQDFFVFAPKTGGGVNYEKLGYSQPFMLPIVESNELRGNVDIQRIWQSQNDKKLFLVYYHVRSGATNYTAKIGVLNMITKLIEIIPSSTNMILPNGNPFIDNDNFIYYDGYQHQLVKVRFSTKQEVWRKNFQRPTQITVVKDEAIYMSRDYLAGVERFDINGNQMTINGANVGVDANMPFAVLPNGIMIIQPSHCKLITKNKATATLIAQANGETTRQEPYYDSVSGNVIVFASNYIMIFNDKMVRISYTPFRDNRFTNRLPIVEISGILYFVSFYDAGYAQSLYTLYKIDPADWKITTYYNNGLFFNSPILFKGNDKILLKMGTGSQYHPGSDRINIITEDIKKKSDFIKEITK